MDQPTLQTPHEEEQVPLYVQEYHLIYRDKEKIEEALKNPATQKFVWFNIITLILQDHPKERASEVLAQLKAYASMLPEVEKKKTHSIQPRAVS